MFTGFVYPETFYLNLDEPNNCIAKALKDLNMQNYPPDGSDDSNQTNSTSPGLSPSSGCQDYTMSPPSQRVPHLEFGTSNQEFDGLGHRRAPYLVVTQQPSEKFRFRYESEMCGMHGSLLGKIDMDKKRAKNCVPTVELKNYDERARIVCSLVQNNLLHNPHAHRVVRSGEPDADFIYVDVDPQKGYSAKFTGMAIIHTAKKKIYDELYRIHSNSADKKSKLQLQQFCEAETSNIKLNTVCLCFTAYDANSQPVCAPVYSTPIDNMKSAETGELKIVRMSMSSSSCSGGEEVFFFIEKVSKKNIKIRFFEIDEEDNRTWEAYGSFSELDVHHQYAIAFRTPPYRDPNIDRDVNVYVELYRPKDQAVSLPKQFRYKAAPRTHKRRRAAERSLSSLMSSREDSRLSSDELSLTKLPLSVTDMETFTAYKSSEFNDKVSHDRFGGNPDFLNTTFNTSCITSSLDAINYTELYNIEGMDQLNEDDIVKLLKNMDQSDLRTDGRNPKAAENIKKDQMVLLKAKEECRDEAESAGDGDVDTEDLYPAHDIKAAKVAISVINSCMRAPPTSRSNVAKRLLDLFSEKLSRGDSFLHMFVTIKVETALIEKILDLVNEYDLDILNMTNDHRETALHKTVTYLQSEMMELLLSAGCNPNLADENGNTPLHLAVKERDAECMSCLFNKSLYDTKYAHKLDVNIYNNDGLTPLLIAARDGSVKSVSILLRGGADCHLTARNNCWSALHYAVETSHIQLVKYLLTHSSVPVNGVCQNGCTAFHYACVQDDPDALKICQMLLESGADPMLKYQHLTGLELARNKHNSRVVAVIEEYIKNQKVKDDIIPPEKIKKETDDSVLDAETMDAVAVALNESGNWKALAHKLDLEVMIPMCDNFDNPSRMLLTRIEIHCPLSARGLLNVLVELQETKAVNIIKQMLNKNNGG